MKEDYNGHEIEWSDFGRSFTIKKDGHNLKTNIKTVEECVKWIDHKTKQKFKRLPCYLIIWGNVYEAEITSVIDSLYVWVSTKKGRSKESLLNTVLRNEQTQKIVAQIKQESETIEALQESKKKLMDSLPRITADMVIEE